MPIEGILRDAQQPGQDAFPITRRPRETAPEVRSAISALRREVLFGNPEQHLATLNAWAERNDNPDFDPFSNEYLEEFPYMRDHYAKLVHVRTEPEARALAAQIGTEMQDNENIAKAPITGFVFGMAGAFISPENLVPVGLALRGAKGVWNTTKRTAQAGAMGASIGEAGLAATQEIRPPEEFVYGVAGSAVLGGVLGGAVSSLNKGGRALLRRQLELVTADLKADAASFTENGKVLMGSGTVRQRIQRATRRAERRLGGLATPDRVAAAEARVGAARDRLRSTAENARERIREATAQARGEAAEGRAAGRAAAEERTQIEGREARLAEDSTTPTRDVPNDEALSDVQHAAIREDDQLPDFESDAAREVELLPEELEELRRTDPATYKALQGGGEADPRAVARGQALMDALDGEASITPKQQVLNQIMRGDEAAMTAAGLTPKQRTALLARLEEGPIDAVDDLLDVKGIGPKTLEKLDAFAERPLRDVPDEQLFGEPEGLEPITEQIPLDGDAFVREAATRADEARTELQEAHQERVDALTERETMLAEERQNLETRRDTLRGRVDKAEERAAQERGRPRGKRPKSKPRKQFEEETPLEAAEAELFDAVDNLQALEEEIDGLTRAKNEARITRKLAERQGRKILGRELSVRTGPEATKPELVGQEAPLLPGETTATRRAHGKIEKQRADTEAEQVRRNRKILQQEPTSGGPGGGPDKFSTARYTGAQVKAIEDAIGVRAGELLQDLADLDARIIDEPDLDALRELFGMREELTIAIDDLEGVAQQIRQRAGGRAQKKAVKVKGQPGVVEMRDIQTNLERKLELEKERLIAELRRADDLDSPAGIAQERRLADVERMLAAGEGTTTLRGVGPIDVMDDVTLLGNQNKLKGIRAADDIATRIMRQAGDTGVRAELPSDMLLIDRWNELEMRRQQLNDEIPVAGVEELAELQAEQRQILEWMKDPALGLTDSEISMRSEAIERGQPDFEHVTGERGGLTLDEMSFEEAQSHGDALGVDAEDVLLYIDPDGKVGGGIDPEDYVPTGVTVLQDTVTRILGLPNQITRKLLRFNPILRMALSDLDSSRMMIQLLTDTGIDWRRFGKGYPAFESVFDRVQRRWGAKEFEILKAIPELYLDDLAKLRGVPRETLEGFITKKTTLAREAAGRELGITQGDVTGWYREVTQTVRNGGIDPKGREGVQKAARLVMDLFDEALTEGTNLKLFSPELRETYRSGYMTRLWNIPKLMAEKEAWVKQVAELLHLEQKISFDKALGIADTMHHSITAGPAGRMDSLEPELSPVDFAHRKTRVVEQRRVPGADTDWSAGGWLIDDVDVILRFWFRTVPPDLELARLDAMLTPTAQQLRPGWRPDPSLRATLYRAKRHAKNQIMAETEVGSPERLAMTKQLARAYGTTEKPGDLPAMVQILRRTYGIPKNPNSPLVRGSIAMRNFNYLADGGTFWLSSLPDVGRPVMVHGIERVYGTGIRALLHDWDTVKLNAREAQIAGTAADMVTNRRVQELYDLGMGYGRGSKFERVLKRVADEYSILNGLAVHNTYIKQWEATIAGQHILDDAQIVATGRHPKNRKATHDEVMTSKRRLNGLTIDLDLARRIWGQVENNAVPNGILREIRSEDWSDTFAQGAFRTALRRSIDSTINTPQPGVRPLAYSKEMGKFILQYKSFAFASAMQTLIPGLQHPTWAWVHGAGIATGFGMASIYLKSVAGGWDVPGPDDVGWWIRNGVDASGVWGIFGDINNTLGYATRGDITLGHALTGKIDPAFRYTSRGPIGAIFGPSVSTVSDLGRVVAGIGEIPQGRQPPERAYNAFKRTLPGNNHILVNRTFFQPVIAEMERYMRREFADELTSNIGVPRVRP